MKLLPVLFFFLLSSFAPTSNSHPFYISVFEINHNAKEKAVQVTVKIFADDMEKVLGTKYKTAIDLANEGNREKNETMINGYLQENFSLKLDGKAAVLKMIGFEREKESVYVYMEVSDVVSIKKLEVRNSVLYDLTSDQANIMHVIVGGKRQSKKLNFPEREVVFEY